MTHSPLVLFSRGSSNVGQNHMWIPNRRDMIWPKGTESRALSHWVLHRCGLRTNHRTESFPLPSNLRAETTCFRNMENQDIYLVPNKNTLAFYRLLEKVP